MTVGFIRRQAGERDQPVGLVVADLVRHKVTQQVPAQPWNEVRRDLCSGGELGVLERVDFVADEPGDGHDGSFV